VNDIRDPYHVLGVPRHASVQAIRAAYVERARRAHPDIVGTRGLDSMRALNEAWAILKDASRRAAFDAANGGPSTQAPAASAFGDDPDRPFWTGAMGSPPGRPWGPVVNFGIFAGWSIGEISRRDRGYLAWLQERPEAADIRDQIAQMLDPDAEPAAASPRRRGPLR
jgi:curved DNA-binding protein CbpA